MKIDWVRHHMPLLNGLEKEFSAGEPFKGLKIALSVHLEAKTAYLCEVLAAGGAEMYVTGSNPLSTQDDVAAALVKEGLNVFAWYGATSEDYKRHIRKVLEIGPNIIIDDGGDLVSLMHSEFQHLIPDVIGGCEETTTGILRLQSMNRARTLQFPMMLVNNADCKHLFDNRYGTGQSVWTGINRTTNLIVAGKTVVVAGYGWCGKGVAMRAKGQGAKVIVTEVDPIRAMEAMMDAFSLWDTFDFFACANPDGTGGEKPVLIRRALDALGEHDNSRAVMIGDTRYDAAGARDTAVPFIGVLYGYGTREDMEEQGARVFAADAGELRRLLIG